MPKTRIVNSSETGQTITPNNLLVVLTGILAISLNGLLLIAMLRKKATIFTSNGSYLVANLAVADLLTGVSALRYGIANGRVISKFVNGIFLSLFWPVSKHRFLSCL